jgi:hypothetical protein
LNKQKTRRQILLTLSSILLVFLTIHVVGVCLDFLSAVRYPFQFDYAEGIVWQQGLLIPGDRMFRVETGFPFIMFNYPPLFFYLVRAAQVLWPDYLTAGRAVAALGAIAVTPSLFACVLVATRHPTAPRSSAVIGAAIAAALFLCLDPARTWGLEMRVDLPGIAFGWAGIAIAARAGGRFWGTLAALLLCLAAVFTKQSLLPAGIAVFLFALLRRPGPALGAGILTASIGVGIVVVMQVVTDGGFLTNIIGYNLNRFDYAAGLHVIWGESDTFPFVMLMLASASWVAASLQMPVRRGVRRLAELIRDAGPAQACRILLLLHYVLATAMLVTIFKSGSNLNYLLDWFASGCVMLGIMLTDVSRIEARTLGHSILLTLLAALVLSMPFRQLPDHPYAEDRPALERLIREVAAADAPVASENIGLLMRAGKTMMFEPAGVTDLAMQGRWNETPLVDMIKGRRFAFMVTTDDIRGAGDRRTVAVDQAMREAYPIVEQPMKNLWVRYPPGARPSIN